MRRRLSTIAPTSGAKGSPGRGLRWSRRAHRLLPSLLMLLGLLSLSLSARAQLASSFYNVTEIKTRVLPNAVQVIIRTDGWPIYGTDLSDFLDISNGLSQPKAVRSFRLRLVRARASLPTFVEIGAYPIEAAQVTLGRTPIASPYFSNGGYDQAEPRVDIELRFFTPVTVRRFGVEMGSSGVSFGSVLEPRDVSVERGLDGRSIIITAIPDRVDAGGAARLLRSPEEDHKHRLTVTRDPMARDRFRIDALHAPLDSVLDAVARRSGTPILSLAGTDKVDVSLLMPSATIIEFLDVIATAYNLSITTRGPGTGGGFAVGPATEAAVIERLPLRHMSPEQARLLFPDFLLPRLRADKENNALVVSGTPELVDRVRRDLQKLDQPRGQVRVEVSAWEFSDERAAELALSTIYTGNRGSIAFDSVASELSLRLESDQQRAFRATVQALVTTGRARLMARPFVVVASGEQGTLFLGQKRFLPVLQNQEGQQNLEILELPIGYSLTVKPRVGDGSEITLDLTPRASTVDAIEAGTRLPTLGVRETSSTVRLRSSDAIIVAGLDAHLKFNTRGRLSYRSNETWTSLILLVTARKI